jgi:hypothetical protein
MIRLLKNLIKTFKPLMIFPRLVNRNGRKLINMKAFVINKTPVKTRLLSKKNLKLNYKNSIKKQNI